MTINPYLKGGRILFYRLSWDLHPYSWISRKRIRAWKNRYSDSKAVILCNGPSLNKVDFNLLGQSGIFAFGLNKINLLFDRTHFRPSVVVAVNPFVLTQNADFLNATQIPLFLDAVGRKKVRFRRNVHFLHNSRIVGGFAGDCSISVNQGYTVTYVAMQLAFHMGFREIALVGCDHSFSSKGLANKAVKSGKSDPNHFDPSYFSGGQLWQFPDLTLSELHYQIAKEYFEMHQRCIVNCTDGGQLEVFERKHLFDFLSDNPTKL